MRQRTAVVNFVLGVVFHNPTHENGGAECCDHKADVAAHKVERIENVAIENAYVAPRTIGKDARQIAEQEDAAKRQIDGAAQADAQTFDKHADDHLIDGQRRRQSSNHQQQEEDDRKEVAEEHFGECDRQRLEDKRRAGIGSQIGAKERRKDHESRHYGHQRIDNARNNSCLDHVFLLVQVRRKRDHHTETKRQGKEHLAEHVKEKSGRDFGEVRCQIEAHASCSVVEREVANHHDQQAQQQQRHQVLHRAFDALNDAFAQDHPIDENEDERVTGDGKGGMFNCVGIETFGEFFRDRTRKVQASGNACGAEENMPDVRDHPAADYHVVGENAEGAQKPRVAKEFPQRTRGIAGSTACQSKGVDAVGLCAAADDVFNKDNGNADEHHDGNEGDVCATAVFTDEIRKAPCGAESDRRAGNGQDIGQAA